MGAKARTRTVPTTASAGWGVGWGRDAGVFTSPEGERFRRCRGNQEPDIVVLTTTKRVKLRKEAP